MGNDDGRFEEARRTYAEQATMGAAVGDDGIHWDAYANMGLSLQYLGRYAEAMEVLERTAAWYREHGGVTVNGILKINRGRLRALLGDPEQGLEELEGGLSMLRSVGQRRPEGYALHRMAVVHEQLGHAREADDWYRAALALRKETRYGAGILKTLAAWGRFQWVSGDQAAALSLLEEADGRAQELDSLPGKVLVGCYRALAGVEDTSSIRELLRVNDTRLRAAERLDAWFTLWRVDGVGDDLSRANAGLEALLTHAPADARSQMIARVPLHRAIHEAAGRSGP